MPCFHNGDHDGDEADEEDDNDDDTDEEDDLLVFTIIILILMMAPAAVRKAGMRMRMLHIHDWITRRPVFERPNLQCTC